MLFTPFKLGETPQAPAMDGMPNPLSPHDAIVNSLHKIGGGDVGVNDDKKPKNPMAEEMKVLYNKPLQYDNIPASQAVKNAATKVGVNPALLFSSTFQEGLNKALVPREREKIEKYLKENNMQTEGFPVNGYQYYGLDTIGDRLPELVKKGYLPQDFANNMKVVPMYNDHKKKVGDKWVDDPQPINSANFKNNESALMAKAAFVRDSMDKVKSYAAAKKINLDDDALNYFTLAAYNSGEGNAQKMLEKYAASKDKKAFIEKGDKNWQNVHKNISPRMANMKLANELLNTK